MWRLIAYAAAAVVIVSLGFSTFMQQLTSFNALVAASNMSSLLPGNLPRSKTYSAIQGPAAAKGVSRCFQECDWSANVL